MIPPIANVSSPGPVDIGDIANWTVTLDLRDAVNKIEIDAWVNGTYEYPVCSISVGEIGKLIIRLYFHLQLKPTSHCEFSQMLC